MAWLAQFDDFSNSVNNNQATLKVQTQTKFRYHSDFGNTNSNTNTNSTHDDQVAQTPIQDLSPYSTQTHIVGLVIAKQQPREINKKGSDGSTRFVLNFTLRDAPDWYINAACWGSRDYVTSLASSFHWGDIIEVRNAQVQSKPSDGSDIRYKPFTTSNYVLTLSERHSTVHMYSGWDNTQYTSLQHTLVRPANDYYVLGDIMQAGQSLNNEHVNILAAVRSVSGVKQMVTNNGRSIKKCEVRLYDDTCPSFTLVLWDEEIINQAISWNPGEYVVFGADLKIYYDDYRSCMVSTADSRTIFTVNPDTKQAHDMYNYAQNNPPAVDSLNSFSDNNGTQKDPELCDIKKVYSVAEMIDLQDTLNLGTKNVEFGIIYGHISAFDVDNELRSIVRYKCSSCNKFLKKIQPVCQNPACMEDNQRPAYVLMEYSIALNVSDHTGTLSNCYLYQNVAERMLTCKAEEYMRRREDERYWTQVKWKYLLEKCKVYVKIQKKKSKCDSYMRIMSCERLDPKEHFFYMYRCLAQLAAMKRRSRISGYIKHNE